jgi:hypothetical protein
VDNRRLSTQTQPLRDRSNYRSHTGKTIGLCAFDKLPGVPITRLPAGVSQSFSGSEIDEALNYEFNNFQLRPQRKNDKRIHISKF